MIPTAKRASGPHATARVIAIASAFSMIAGCRSLPATGNPPDRKSAPSTAPIPRSTEPAPVALSNPRTRLIKAVFDLARVENLCVARLREDPQYQALYANMELLRTAAEQARRKAPNERHPSPQMLQQLHARVELFRRECAACENDAGVAVAHANLRLAERDYDQWWQRNGATGAATKDESALRYSYYSDIEKMWGRPLFRLDPNEPIVVWDGEHRDGAREAVHHALFPNQPNTRPARAARTILICWLRGNVAYRVAESVGSQNAGLPIPEPPDTEYSKGANMIPLMR